jgi:ketosteroid isomerase-like protein
VGVTEANARQLHVRARRQLAESDRSQRTPPRHARPDRSALVRLVERFLAAAREGDLPALEALLADDVTAWADGGGRVTAARLPVHGRDRVAVYLSRLLGRNRGRRHGVIAEVNGGPAVLGFVDGTLTGVLEVDARDGVVAQVRLHVNPDKLAFLAEQMSQRRPPASHTS